MPAEPPGPDWAPPSLAELRRLLDKREDARTPEEQAILDEFWPDPPVERPAPELNKRGIRFFVRYARRTHPEAIKAVADLIWSGLERESREQAALVERGEACWLPWASPVPPPPALTEDDLRKRPRYRGSRRRS